MYAVKHASGNDMERLQRFLSIADGAYQHIDPSISHFFFVEEIEKQKIVGTVGLELHQLIGILRSFVIDGSVSDARIGFALIGAVLAYAKHLSVRKLVLFTNSEPFFEKIGFQKVPFDLLPKVVLETEYANQVKNYGIPMVVDCQKSDRNV